MTTAPPDHIHISEREADGTWEDCTWDSGLEWYRLVYDARKPATHAEAQLLRRASGEPATGGSNLGDLTKGIKVRYGTTIAVPLRSYTDLYNAMVKGNRAAVIQGSMSAFGPNHRLSIFDRNMDSGHAVVLIYYAGQLLWCDPEAPTKADVPVRVTWAEVKAFVTALPGAQHLVGPIKRIVAPPDTATEEPVGISFTVIKSEKGTATTTRLVSLLDTATSEFTPIPAGYVRGTAGRVTIKDGKYAGQGAYLCHMDGRSQLLLASAATYVPDPPPIVKPDPAVIEAAVKAAVTLDRTKAFVAYKP